MKFRDPEHNEGYIAERVISYWSGICGGNQRALQFYWQGLMSENPQLVSSEVLKIALKNLYQENPFIYQQLQRIIVDHIEIIWGGAESIEDVFEKLAPTLVDALSKPTIHRLPQQAFT